ncbi:MAG: hypothetical protein ACFFD4_37435 [Candidatus Odinarchaeota archaeon]
METIDHDTPQRPGERQSDTTAAEDRTADIINLARYLFFLMTSPRPLDYRNEEMNIDLSNIYHGVLSSEIEQLCSENSVDSDEILAYLNYICEITGLELVKLDLELILPEIVPRDEFFSKGLYMVRTPNAIEDSMDNVEYAVAGLSIYLFQKQGPFQEKDFKQLVNTLRPYSRKSNGNKNGKKREYIPAGQLQKAFRNLAATGYLWRAKKSNKTCYTISPKMICMFPKDKREALHHQIDKLLLKEVLDKKE